MSEKNSRRKKKEKLLETRVDDVESFKSKMDKSNGEDSKTDDESILTTEKPTEKKEKSKKRRFSHEEAKPPKKKVFAAYIVIEQDNLGLFPQF